MVETAKYYLEGETKGNMSASMMKVYSESYAQHRGDDMWRNVEFQKALAEQKAFLEQKNKESRINIDKRFNDRYNACVDRNDNTNAIRCVENMAKNRGYYEADNKQKAEQVSLDEAMTEEARRIARIINLEEARQGRSQAAG